MAVGGAVDGYKLTHVPNWLQNQELSRLLHGKTCLSSPGRRGIQQLGTLQQGWHGAGAGNVAASSGQHFFLHCSTRL